MIEPYVLCVDDEAIITESLKRELRNDLPHLRVEAAYSGEAALKLMEEIGQDGAEPSVLVTDERMPGMKGHSLLQEGRRRYPRLFGILLTGFSDIDAIAQAVNEASLFRYFKKPWKRYDLVKAVRRATELYDRESEFTALLRRGEELNFALISALENPEQAGAADSVCRVHRVACVAALLGRRMGLPESEVRRLYLYAPFHDIGKIGISSEILKKSGTLSPKEFEAAKQHIRIGARLLESVDIDSTTRDLILYHHERWDGQGYLAEMRGEDIPLSARITALADVFDTMLADRPYQKASSFDDAVREIEADSGTRFDPSVVAAFQAEKDSLRRIASGQVDEYRSQFQHLV